MRPEQDDGDTSEPIDWAAAASRHLRHTTALVNEALGDIGPLEDREKRFIHQIAYAGGFVELASRLGKVRAAASTTAASPPLLATPEVVS